MKKLIALGVVLAAVAAAVFWFRRSKEPADAEDGKPVASVEVTPLLKQPISATREAFGVVEASPAGASALTVGYDCVVREILAPAGSRVADGEAVLKVDPTPDAKLQIDSARGAAKLALASLAAARQRFELKLATSDDLRAAEQAAEDAELKVESFSKRGMGETATLAALHAGVVVKLDAQPGTVVPAGTALATLAYAGNLQARLGAEVSEIASFKPGQKVTIASVSRPDLDPVEAALGSVGASVDATSGSADLRVALPQDGTWLAGERVRARIEVATKTALVAPRSAVLPDDEDQVLYTVKDHKAVKHTVQVGIASGDLVEVIGKDLQAGDSVVTLGNYELADGMAVQLPGEGEKAGGKDDDKAAAKNDDEKAPAKHDDAKAPDKEAKAEAEPKAKAEAKP